MFSTYPERFAWEAVAPWGQSPGKGDPSGRARWEEHREAVALLSWDGRTPSPFAMSDFSKLSFIWAAMFLQILVWLPAHLHTPPSFPFRA